VKALPKGEGGKSLPNFLESFKDDKYTNVGNLKEVNFDKIAATKPEVIFISGRTANQKNLDEFKKAAPKAKIVYVGADEKNLMMYGVDVAKKHPIYNSNNPEYERGQFGERYISQRSNYEFNRLQYQIIDMLSKILDKHPLPKSDNNYKHIPTIEKAILSGDSHS
ncbi:hypothetical protein PED48_14125, partial [Staphylococcus aureus]|nr:hypothetical protein [Staphylococcus aureus]